MKPVSKNVHVGEGDQLELLMKPRPEPCDVPISTITRRPTFLRAIHLAQEVSGLEDKQICGAIGIDLSHWSKIKSGASHFPTDERLLNYLNVVNSDIPLIWLAESRGYDWTTIQRHHSDLERQVEDLKRQLADRDRALALVLKVGKQ